MLPCKCCWARRPVSWSLIASQTRLSARNLPSYIFLWEARVGESRRPLCRFSLKGGGRRGLASPRNQCVQTAEPPPPILLEGTTLCRLSWMAPWRRASVSPVSPTLRPPDLDFAPPGKPARSRLIGRQSLHPGYESVRGLHRCRQSRSGGREASPEFDAGALRPPPWLFRPNRPNNRKRGPITSTLALSGKVRLSHP